jgi:hypothetical protein
LLQQKVNQASQAAEQQRNVEIQRIAKFLREGGGNATSALKDATDRFNAKKLQH